MGIFDKIFAKKYTPVDSPASILFAIAYNSAQYFIDKKQPNYKFAEFEAILFSLNIILRTFRVVKPNEYNELSQVMYLEIRNYAEKVGVLSKIKIDFRTFINSRTQLYLAELSMINKEKGYLPSKILYNFYENPLQIDSGHCNSAPLLLKFTLTLNDVVYGYIVDNLKIVLNRYYK